MPPCPLTPQVAAPILHVQLSHEQMKPEWKLLNETLNSINNASKPQNPAVKAVRCVCVS